MNISARSAEIELTVLAQKKLLLKHAGADDPLYPANVKDPAGFWTGIYITGWVLAYNTKLVRPQATPKTYADLLNPKWKGMMGMDTEPYSWFITSYRYLESRLGAAGAIEYFRKLASQDLEWRKGHSLIGQLIAAGEFPIGVEMQAGSVERSKAQGAPVDWVALDGVMPINNVGASISTCGNRQFVTDISQLRSESYRINIAYYLAFMPLSPVSFSFLNPPTPLQTT